MEIALAHSCSARIERQLATSTTQTLRRRKIAISRHGCSAGESASPVMIMSALPFSGAYAGRRLLGCLAFALGLRS